MLKLYILGFLKLNKIHFDIENCQDIYFFQSLLDMFMRAENKKFEYVDFNKFVTSKPFSKPLIIAQLPQFSERIHEQIKKVRTKQDSKLSTKRIFKEEQPIAKPELGKFASNKKDSFFENNEALFLTLPELSTK